MKINEQSYNGVTLFISLGILLGAFNIYHLAPDPDIKPALYNNAINISIWGLVFAASLGVTSLINLILKRLLFATTIIQIVTCAVTILLLPIAIWGIILLVRRSKTKTAN